MAAGVVSFCHDIEQEGLNIVIQRFVVQEKFGQQTQVLTVDLEAKGEENTAVYHSPVSQEGTAGAQQG